MIGNRNAGRVDTVKLKAKISKKLGRQKAEKYFSILSSFISNRLSKPEFDKLCVTTIGKKNLALHNYLIKSILSNAYLGHSPPGRQTATGNSRTPRGKLGETLPKSPGTGRLSERPRIHGQFGSSLAPEVANSCEVLKVQEQGTAPGLISNGSKGLVEVVSVEEGEEVEQMRYSWSIQSRSPLQPPYGVKLNLCDDLRKSLHGGSVGSFLLSQGESLGDCSTSSELPDTITLRNRLEHRLKNEGLNASIDCINLLNNALDLHLKRLIKPCLELVGARCGSNKRGQVNKPVHGVNGDRAEQVYQSSKLYSVSRQDFQMAMELSPQLLGTDWPTQLEKLCLRD